MTDIVRLDATALRVLAHPLRARLLTALRVHGPATATELAGRLGTNTGATSYHLRRLEEVGLVADNGEGSGRRRVWEPTSRGHSWQPSDFAGDPDAAASLAWLTDFYLGTHAEYASAWARHAPQWPARWRDALGQGDDGVVVTAEQAEALRDELFAVLHRYRTAGAGHPDAVRLLAVAALYPMDADRGGS